MALIRPQIGDGRPVHNRQKIVDPEKETHMENFVNMEQGTSHWLEWRKHAIGSSDVASILGLSPWKTRRQLWLEKTGKVQVEDISNQWQVQRGTQNEGRARAQVELMLGQDFPPELSVHPKYDFMRVSLDGKSGNKILEIKIPSQKVMDQVEKGEVPDYYMAQVQYQLMCVEGSEGAIFFCMNPETGKSVKCDVAHDLAMQMKIEKAVVEFWDSVQKEIEPDPEDKDFLEVKDHKFLALATQYKFAKIDAKKAIEALEQIEEKIKEFTEVHPAIYGGGIRVLKYSVNGSIDYSKIEALKSVDLEQYRKPASKRIKITEVKK